MSIDHEAVAPAATTSLLADWWDDPHEQANGLTHGFGLLLAVPAAVALVVAAAEYGGWRLVGCLGYALSLVAVYGASTLSHVVLEPQQNRLWRMLDQGFIYLLIAGSYTPFGVTYLQTPLGWTLTLAMWGIAWFGFFSKVALGHRIDRISVWLYLALGWLPILFLPHIVQHVPASALWGVLAGGVIYTVGVVFLKLDWRRYHFHAIWHLLVIAASAVHFWTIFRHCA